jgi:hypothetical protein
MTTRLSQKDVEGTLSLVSELIGNVTRFLTPIITLGPMTISLAL